MSKQQCFPVHLSTEPQRDIFTTRTVTQGLCFFNCAMDTHTHTGRESERAHLLLPQPPCSSLLPSPGLHYISSSWGVQHIISERGTEEGRVGRVAHVWAIQCGEGMSESSS